MVCLILCRQSLLRKFLDIARQLSIDLTRGCMCEIFRGFLSGGGITLALTCVVHAAIIEHVGCSRRQYPFILHPGGKSPKSHRFVYLSLLYGSQRSH